MSQGRRGGPEQGPINRRAGGCPIKPSPSISSDKVARAVRQANQIDRVEGTSPNHRIFIRMSGSHQTRWWRKPDSNLYGAFPVKWCFRFIASSLFGAGKAVLRPVACDQVRGARGRGQGTETLAKLGGFAALIARGEDIGMLGA